MFRVLRPSFEVVMEGRILASFQVPRGFLSTKG